MLEGYPQFQEEYQFDTQYEFALAYEGLSDYEKANKIMTSIWDKRPEGSNEKIKYLGLYISLANLNKFLGNEQKAIGMYIEIMETPERQKQTEHTGYVCSSDGVNDGESDSRGHFGGMLRHQINYIYVH